MEKKDACALLEELPLLFAELVLTAGQVLRGQLCTWSQSSLAILEAKKLDQSHCVLWIALPLEAGTVVRNSALQDP